MATAVRETKATARAKQRPHAAVSADAPLSDQQIAGIAEVLNRHGVDYVLVGGAASQLHGAPVDVRVAALRDVIRSKEAAGRPKDLAVLATLLDHLRKSSG